MADRNSPDPVPNMKEGISPAVRAGAPSPDQDGMADPAVVRAQVAAARQGVAESERERLNLANPSAGVASVVEPSEEADPRDGKIEFVVLRPFTFTYAVPMEIEGAGVRYNTTERAFLKGTYLLDPNAPENQAMFAHPFIGKHFADGAVEPPHVTAQRKRDEHERAKIQAEENQRQLEIAEAAFRRAEAMATRGQGQQARVVADLNTPIGGAPKTPQPAPAVQSRRSARGGA